MTLAGDCEFAIDEVSDCLQGGLAREARGAGDRAVSGMDLGAPAGTETVCDLGEHTRGADFPRGNVVGTGDPHDG